MRLSHPEQISLNLAATVDADVSRLYWFAGGSYIGDSAAGDPVAWTPPHAGRFRLSVVDDHGREDAREIEVAVVQ
jgi:penicillin-binding protein 1C